MIFLWTLVFQLAQASDFEGCGEYLLKGIYRKDNQYIVNEHSRSQMKFEIAENGEVLEPMLNKSTSLKARIYKNMDGTKGKIKDLKEISLRYPDPLSPKDTGIFLIKSSKCE